MSQAIGRHVINKFVSHAIGHRVINKFVSQTIGRHVINKSVSHAIGRHMTGKNHKFPREILKEKIYEEIIISLLSIDIAPLR